MGIVINSCVTGVHGTCLFSLYMHCLHIPFESVLVS